jgi:Secretion system C-terminal sorting domain
MKNLRASKFKTFFFLLLSFVSQKITAQIVIGDIAFTGFNSFPLPPTGSDDFSFIILRTGGLPANSVINFTDCCWNGTTCGTNNLVASNGTTETDIAWTSPNSVLSYGTQVRITALIASQGTVSGTAISLSGIGDQIFAFTGPRTAATFIAGIQINIDAGATASNWDNLPTTSTSTTASNRPSCLTDGTYSVWFATELDNGVLSCSVTISTNKATALAQIYNSANWNRQDGTIYTLPRSCPLPIELIDFQAKNTEGGMLLTWQTAYEKDNLGFHVQHSRDGYVFENIGFVKGSGTTLQTQNYTFEDKRTLNLLAYYRLKQEDYDGKIDYSNIITVQLKGSSKVKIYHTLTGGELRIEGAIFFAITDINGQVFSQSTKSENLYTISNLASGMYIVKGMDTEGGSFLKKIVVLDKY